MSDLLTIICGQCDSPAKFHSSSYRNITVGVCDRGEDFIHPDRGDFTSVTGDFRGKTVSDYYVDVPMHKILKAYFSGWGHNREAMLNLMVNAYVSIDPAGPQARMVRGGLIMDGVAEDRDIWGIGASEVDDPNFNRDLIELSKLDRWSDATHYVNNDGTHSWIGTTVLGDDPSIKETRFDGRKSMAPVVSDNNQFISHSAYVEGFDGFTTLKGEASASGMPYDEPLTLKHHERILNVYQKNGSLRCGSVEIHKSDDTVTARCVRGNCEAKPMTINIAKEAAYAEAYELDVSEHLREVMVEFTLAVIRHGNNHAASWFVNRPTWYKVHHPRCTLNDCSDSLHYCPDLLPVVPNNVESLVSEKDLTELAEYVNLQRSA